MKRWRSQRYLEWARSLPCAVPGCGCPADDFHHIKHVGHFSGCALKADDILGFPACRNHHDMLPDDEELKAMQYELICRTVLRAVREGVLKV